MSPSTPLGPVEDAATAWTTWVTLMGCLGTHVLTLVSAPVARRVGPTALAATTSRLAVVGATFGVLAIPAVLSDVARDSADGVGYDYAGAWRAVFDGSNAGRLLGIELTLTAVAVVLTVPLVSRRVAGSRARTGLLVAGTLAGAVALGTTKFPDGVPDDWSRTTFETVMWMLHLGGGAIWIGGLLGLLALAVPGAVAAGERAWFWSPLIRRFSITAMSSVAAIGLSGLWLYWEHVDGPSQLFTTMYGRTLGVKLLIFGSMLVLGIVNQFWLHPKIEALRAAGDERPLRTILVREFRGTVAVEAVLGMSVLFVAPMLHGSARNQAFQAAQARHGVPLDDLAKVPTKVVSGSTWAWGIAETLLVIAVMVVGYRLSGRVAQSRTVAARSTQELVQTAM
jgi:putative copper export protein